MAKKIYLVSYNDTYENQGGNICISESGVVTDELIDTIKEWAKNYDSTIDTNGIEFRSAMSEFEENLLCEFRDIEVSMQSGLKVVE